MELFGIGPLELIFIFIIILLVLGPKDIEKTARNAGRLINRVNRSPNYQVVRRASEELRNLPARLAREAQLDELKDLANLDQVKAELKNTANTIGRLDQPLDAWLKDLGQSGPTPAAPPATTPPPVASTPPSPSPLDKKE